MKMYLFISVFFYNSENEMVPSLSLKHVKITSSSSHIFFFLSVFWEVFKRYRVDIMSTSKDLTAYIFQKIFSLSNIKFFCVFCADVYALY